MVALLQFVLVFRESTRTLKTLFSGSLELENIVVEAVVVLVHMLQLQAVLAVVLRLREGVFTNVCTVKVVPLRGAQSPQLGGRKSKRPWR